MRFSSVLGVIAFASTFNPHLAQSAPVRGLELNNSTVASSSSSSSMLRHEEFGSSVAKQDLASSQDKPEGRRNINDYLRTLPDVQVIEFVFQTNRTGVLERSFKQIIDLLAKDRKIFGDQAKSSDAQLAPGSKIELVINITQNFHVDIIKNGFSLIISLWSRRNGDAVNEMKDAINLPSSKVPLGKEGNTKDITIMIG